MPLAEHTWTPPNLPRFTDEEFDILYGIAYKVVDAMVAEYKTPMVLDQATISFMPQLDFFASVLDEPPISVTRAD